MLVTLTPIENLIGYIWINLVSGVISWKLGPSLVPGRGASLGARIQLGDLSGAQPAWRRRDAVENVRSRAGILPAGEGGEHGWGPAAGAGAGWPRWDRGAIIPSWRPQARCGPSSRQDLGLRGLMLPAWCGRPGGDRDIWWEFLMAELCVGLGCWLI